MKWRRKVFASLLATEDCQLETENAHLDSPTGKRLHDVAYWGVMLIACAIFYWMNVLTPFKEDDMAYSLIGHGSLIDFLQSRYEHFMTTNGRFSDTVATIFCGFFGKPVFNVCNTLVFALLMHLLSLLSTGRRSVLVLTMFLAYVGCSFPVPGETMLFLAGSCNYLWGITASLLLVRYLLRRQPDSPLGTGRGALLLLCAFIAGNFNEATSFGFLAGMTLFYLFNRQRFSRAVLVAMVGYLLGALLIAASPAAWSRAAGGDIVLNLGLNDLLSSRWHIFAEKLCRFVTPVAALAVGIGTLLWKGFRPIRQCLWSYVVPCLALLMFALGSLGERAYSPLSTASFIVVAIAADTLLSRWQWLRLAAIALGLALTVYTGSKAMSAVKAYKTYEDNNFNEITTAPQQAILLERRFDTYSRFVTPLRYISAEYFVREDIYRDYFGKENVQFVTDSVYRRYHSHRLLDGAVAMPLTTDRPDVIGTFMTFPGQDYMVARLNTDTLPCTSQLALYYNAPGNGALTPEELAYRRRYGLITEYNYKGFYPLRYDGEILLVFPLMDRSISHVVFPLAEGRHSDEATITWQTNPDGNTQAQP